MTSQGTALSLGRPSQSQRTPSRKTLGQTSTTIFNQTPSPSLNLSLGLSLSLTPTAILTQTSISTLVGAKNHLDLTGAWNRGEGEIRTREREVHEAMACRPRHVGKAHLAFGFERHERNTNLDFVSCTLTDRRRSGGCRASRIPVRASDRESGNGAPLRCLTTSHEGSDERMDEVAEMSYPYEDTEPSLPRYVPRRVLPWAAVFGYWFLDVPS